MRRETLIIDDDALFCLLNEKLCKIHGFPEARKFTNAERALEYLLNHNTEEYAYTILLDINMPVMNGWEFLEALAAETLLADVYLILLSSSIDNSDKEKSEGYPLVDGFVTKPLDADKMEQLKEDALLRERLQA